jgi:hypothetical protein
MLYSFEFPIDPAPSPVPKDRMELYERNLPLSRTYSMNLGMDERKEDNEHRMESINDPLFLIYGGNILGTNKVEKSYVTKSKLDAILALMILQEKSELLKILESNSISEYNKIAYLEQYKKMDKPSIAPDIFAGGLNLYGDW